MHNHRENFSHSRTRMRTVDARDLPMSIFTLSSRAASFDITGASTFTKRAMNRWLHRCLSLP